MRGNFNKHIAFILAVFMTALFIPTTSYASNVADDIKYSVSSGDELNFKEKDFNKECDDLGGDSLDYVKFDLPSSSKGILYYDYDGSDKSKVTASTKYYYDKDKSIDDVSFIAADDYSGTVTISYTGWDTDGDEYTGDIKITVSDSDADDIKYSIDSDETVTFKKKDFKNVCQDLNDADLDYVKFTLPSSSKGVLYLEYDDGDYDSKVSSTTKYYYDKDPSISDITFVPDDDYSGTVTISYKGCDEDNNTYSGSVKITVDGSASGDISYSVDAGDDVDFDEGDFNNYCKDENDAKLDYVKFDLPSSSKGILYYDYDGDDEAKVTASTKYYYDKDKSIDDITFVADDDYSGSFEIDFSGYDKDGDTIKGTVAIKVSGDDQTAGDIYLSGTAGSPVTMYDEYFNKKCKDVLDNDLDYVKFTLPSSTTGTLYYNYNSSSALTKVSASTKYYYEDDSPYINKVSFLSSGTSAGTYTLKYTGYDTDGSSFTGQVKITLTAGTGTATTYVKSQYFSDVDEAYSWAVKYVDTLYSTGVLAGTTGNNAKLFYPSTKITRGDFMLLLVRALNLQSSTTTSNFTDVTSGSYYYDAINTAKALGIALGTDNKFYPNSSITREDAMVLTLRAMNKSGSGVAASDVSTLSVYSDKNVISDYAKEAVAALIKSGIITGSDDNKIHPMESITRVQAAAIIYRIKY